MRAGTCEHKKVTVVLVLVYKRCFCIMGIYIIFLSAYNTRRVRAGVMRTKLPRIAVLTCFGLACCYFGGDLPSLYAYLPRGNVPGNVFTYS